MRTKDPKDYRHYVSKRDEKKPCEITQADFAVLVALSRADKESIAALATQARTDAQTIAELRASVARLDRNLRQQLSYSIFLQRGIESVFHRHDIREELFAECPYHAEMIAAVIAREEAAEQKYKELELEQVGFDDIWARKLVAEEARAEAAEQRVRELSHALSELVEVSKIAAMVGMFGDEGIRDDHNGPLPNAIRLLERLARSAPDSAGAK